jgi:hypothetical protein
LIIKIKPLRYEKSAPSAKQRARVFLIDGR